MPAELDLQNLARIPIFAAMEADARRMIAFSGETKLLRTGEVLFRKGDPSDCGYFILSGAIDLIGASSADEQAQTARAFSLIGEIAMISPTERAGTARVREAAGVLKISRSLFHRVLMDYPESAVSVRRFLAGRLKDFARQLELAKQQSFAS